MNYNARLTLMVKAPGVISAHLFGGNAGETANMPAEISAAKQDYLRRTGCDKTAIIR